MKVFDNGFAFEDTTLAINQQNLSKRKRMRKTKSVRLQGTITPSLKNKLEETAYRADPSVNDVVNQILKKNIDAFIQEHTDTSE